MTTKKAFFASLILAYSTAAYTQDVATEEPLQAVEVATEISGQTVATPNRAEQADLFARDSYRIDTIICPFKGDIDYKPGEIECGLLQVPENREDPDSRFIELHFIKMNSRWDKQHKNPAATMQKMKMTMAYRRENAMIRSST